MTDFHRINFTFSFFPGKLNINCISHFGSPEAFKALRRIFPGGPNSNYVYNSSEPCHLNETTGETTGDHKEHHGSGGTQSQTGSREGSGGHKENHGSEGTQSQTGNQGKSGGGKGTDTSSGRPATQKHPVQLVFVPIPEPAGNTQQPQPLILMAPPSGVVTPAQQPLASAGPAPSNTVQSNAGSSSTSSKVTPTVQTGMQKEREREREWRKWVERKGRREGENEGREEREMKGEKKVEREIGKCQG